MNDMIDMSHFVEAKSDQLNADDLIGGPRTITVRKVTGNDGDQPISIFYEGDNNKPFKPCKTIRRVLLAVWGRYANEYVGKSMTIYRDDKVTFGGLETGGIRISHMSDIDKETVVVVMKTKGKKAGIKVQPLRQDQPKPDTSAAGKWANQYLAKIETFGNLDDLNAFANDKAGKLAELERALPNAHRQCVAALDAKRASLSPNTPAAEDPEPPTDHDYPVREDEGHGDQFDDDANT